MTACSLLGHFLSPLPYMVLSVSVTDGPWNAVQMNFTQFLLRSSVMWLGPPRSVSCDAAKPDLLPLNLVGYYLVTHLGYIHTHIRSSCYLGYPLPVTLVTHFLLPWLPTSCYLGYPLPVTLVAYFQLLYFNV